MHLFWHSFDLALARFSQRRAPEREGADPVTLFTSVMDRYAGAWATDVMAVLVLTSVLAAQIAFHNAINRYSFTLAKDGLMPAALGHAHPR